MNSKNTNIMTSAYFPNAYIGLCVHRGRHVNLLQIEIYCNRIHMSHGQSQLNFLTFRRAHAKKFKQELWILMRSVFYIFYIHILFYYRQFLQKIIFDLRSMSICYHHGMTSLQAADGDGLQIWRVRT
jgi:hypothetical protein